MKVVELQHQSLLMAGSPFGANSVSSSETLNWKNGGFDNNEEDY